jgi:hypothetical protein
MATVMCQIHGLAGVRYSSHVKVRVQKLGEVTTSILSPSSRRSVRYQLRWFLRCRYTDILRVCDARLLSAQPASVSSQVVVEFVVCHLTAFKRAVSLLRLGSTHAREGLLRLLATLTLHSGVGRAESALLRLENGPGVQVPVNQDPRPTRKDFLHVLGLLRSNDSCTHRFQLRAVTIRPSDGHANRHISHRQITPGSFLVFLKQCSPVTFNNFVRSGCF